jgi:hypothetical protein
MNGQQVSKFKQLIEACIHTKNYLKLAATTLMLIRNTVISQGISLHVPLKSEAYIHEMMLQINHLLNLRNDFSPYSEAMISQIKLIEKLMEKGKGMIPLRFIKEGIVLYFDLQQVSIPSLKSIGNVSRDTSSKGLFSRLNKSTYESPIHQLISHELSSREQSLRSRMGEGDENAMSELQRISHLKASFDTNKSKKVQISGSLTQDQRYLIFLAQSKAYPLLGIFFLLTTLSFLVLVQITLNLELLSTLGMFFLMFGGGAALSLYLYSLTKRKAVYGSW